MSESSQKRQLEREQPPFCINCSNVMPPVTPACSQCGTTSPHRCRLAKMIDLITGEIFYAPCQDFRHPEAPCGQKGLLFEPKNGTEAKTIQLPKIGEN